MPRQLVGWAELVLGRSMRCIRTLASLVDSYGPYLKTIWPPTYASKVILLSTPKIYSRTVVPLYGARSILSSSPPSSPAGPASEVVLELPHFSKAIDRFGASTRCHQLHENDHEPRETTVHGQAETGRIPSYRRCGLNVCPDL